jgi:hypothetical protein
LELGLQFLDLVLQYLVLRRNERPSWSRAPTAVFRKPFSSVIHAISQETAFQYLRHAKLE